MAEANLRDSPGDRVVVDPTFRVWWFRDISLVRPKRIPRGRRNVPKHVRLLVLELRCRHVAPDRAGKAPYRHRREKRHICDRYCEGLARTVVDRRDERAPCWTILRATSLFPNAISEVPEHRIAQFSLDLARLDRTWFATAVLDHRVPAQGKRHHMFICQWYVTGFRTAVNAFIEGRVYPPVHPVGFMHPVFQHVNPR
jgi:hypothetical protein